MPTPPMVNGEATQPDERGVVTGTSGNDRISGTNGNDSLQGLGGVDKLYGKAGNDSFVIRLEDFAPGAKTQDFIYDFGGAGGYSSSNNDFISLLHFGAGSTFTFDHYGQRSDGSTNTNFQFYTIHSTETGLDYQIFIQSLNGKLLSSAKGDLNFYG